MTNKIDNLTTRLAAMTERRNAPVGSKAGAQDTTSGTRPPAGGDSVKLTSTAQRLARLEAQVRETPDVREEKVGALRQQIADGSYDIDAGRIADNLLKSEASLMPAMNMRPAKD